MLEICDGGRTLGVSRHDGLIVLGGVLDEAELCHELGALVAIEELPDLVNVHADDRELLRDLGQEVLTGSEGGRREGAEGSCLKLGKVGGVKGR